MTSCGSRSIGRCSASGNKAVSPICGCVISRSARFKRGATWVGKVPMQKKRRHDLGVAGEQRKGRHCCCLSTTDFVAHPGAAKGWNARNFSKLRNDIEACG